MRLVLIGDAYLNPEQVVSVSEGSIGGTTLIRVTAPGSYTSHEFHVTGSPLAVVNALTRRKQAVPSGRAPKGARKVAGSPRRRKG